jgi:hypothetical protein
MWVLFFFFISAANCRGNRNGIKQKGERLRLQMVGRTYQRRARRERLPPI